MFRFLTKITAILALAAAFQTVAALSPAPCQAEPAWHLGSFYKNDSAGWITGEADYALYLNGFDVWFHASEGQNVVIGYKWSEDVFVTVSCIPYADNPKNWTLVVVVASSPNYDAAAAARSNIRTTIQGLRRL